MSLTRSFSLGRAVSALVLAFAVSTPALADHWRGRADCPMHQGWHQGSGAGPDSCPLMKGMHGPGMPMPMSDGKVLGVHISDLPNAMLDAANVGYGVSVEQVRPDTAAAAAGIRAGDLITEFAGKPVLSAERLRWLVRKADSGKGVEVKLMREGNPVTVSVTLPEAKPKAKCDRPSAPRMGT